jgi:iron-sulfur cluster assembly accessory protein
MDIEMDATPVIEAPVVVSMSAATRVAEIMNNEPPGSMLRISVEGGGCSGFQYKYDLVQVRENDDLVLERAGATILIDQMSLQFMNGSEIDYVDDLIGAAFKINNPNATAGCGCGTSFSI